MGKDEVGPFFRWQELKRGQRHGDALVTDGHSGGQYNATVGHNVPITGIVRKGGTFHRAIVFETETGTLVAPDSKIHLEFLDVAALPFRKPAAFPGRVGEGGEDAFRCGGITALDDESVVDNG